VIFHYLNQDWKVRSLLIRIKRVKGSQTGENITKAVLPIIEGIISSKQLGFFIADNAPVNDVAIRLILTHLRPDLKTPDSRRVRYLGHIINLIAKAFLFGKDADAFEEDSQTKKKRSKLKAVRELWRKREPVVRWLNLTGCANTFLRQAKAPRLHCGADIAWPTLLTCFPSK